MLEPLKFLIELIQKLLPHVAVSSHKLKLQCLLSSNVHTKSGEVRDKLSAPTFVFMPVLSTSQHESLYQQKIATCMRNEYLTTKETNKSTYLLAIAVQRGGICVLENDEIIAKRCSTPSRKPAILAAFLPKVP